MVDKYAFGYLYLHQASYVALVVKNWSAHAGDTRDAGLLPASERFPGGGHGNPLQYSCLENPMDRGAWWATVHGVTKSWTHDWSDLAHMRVPTSSLTLWLSTGEIHKHVTTDWKALCILNLHWCCQPAATLKPQSDYFRDCLFALAWSCRLGHHVVIFNRYFFIVSNVMSLPYFLSPLSFSFCSCPWPLV